VDGSSSRAMRYFWACPNTSDANCETTVPTIAFSCINCQSFKSNPTLAECVQYCYQVLGYVGAKIAVIMNLVLTLFVLSRGNTNPKAGILLITSHQHALWAPEGQSWEQEIMVCQFGWSARIHKWPGTELEDSNRH
jgi:hypothetical protein